MYFQQGSRKQNLFAFLQPTSNLLLSFVFAGIFPYFIPFLLSFCEKGLSLKFMLSRTGTHTRPGYNRLTYLPSSFIYLVFLLPSTLSPSPPPGFGLITDMQDGSCLLRISIANEAEEKEVQLECVETGAALWFHSQLRPNQGRQHTPGETGEARSSPSNLLSAFEQNPNTQS